MGSETTAHPLNCQDDVTRVDAFLQVVSCERDQVLDVSRWNDWTPPDRGDHRIFFGKYAGQRYHDIPASYLRWMVSLEQPSKSMQKAQQFAKAELERRG